MLDLTVFVAGKSQYLQEPQSLSTFSVPSIL
jgi:hypothetical protein